MGLTIIIVLFGGFVLIAIAILIAFFGTGLVICLYNVHEGRKAHWPTKHIVGACVGGFIVSIPIGFLVAAGIYHLFLAFAG